MKIERNQIKEAKEESIYHFLLACKWWSELENAFN